MKHWKRRWRRHLRPQRAYQGAAAPNYRSRDSIEGIDPGEAEGVDVIAYRGTSKTKIRVRERIPLPAVFCLTENYEEVAECLVGIRTRNETSVQAMRASHNTTPRRIRRRGQSVTRIAGYSAFEDIKRITPAAALVIAAEYDRLRALADMHMRAINLEDWEPTVRKTLSDLGFLELFAITKKSRFDPSAHILKFRTGQKIEEETAGFLIESLLDMAFEEADRKELTEEKAQLIGQSYRGVIEAMENVRLHAYPSSATMNAEDTEIARWWMTGAYDRDAKLLTIVLYDMGVSIPVSLPSWPHWGAIRPILERAFRTRMHFIDDRYDDAAIYAATHMGRTSTGLRHRGKGLPTMREILNDCRWGRLRIASRRGDVVFEKDRPPSRTLRRNPLRGTLVEWVVQL